MRRNRLNEMDWDRIHDDLSNGRHLRARRVSNRVNEYMNSDQYASIHNKVKATNDNIKQLVNDAIEKDGPNCDLNWIDTSEVTDMSYMFDGSKFNGDISKWDVSNVKDMSGMFAASKFNGDISNWDVSNVVDMYCMFDGSKFAGDISNWNVDPVYCNMDYMFDKKSKATIPDWYINLDDDDEFDEEDDDMVESRKSLTNKKALYESIMKSVSKQVKKVLNENNYPAGAEYDSSAPWNQSEDAEILNSLDGVFYINNFYSTVFVNYVKYYYHSEYKNIKKLLNILIDYTDADRAEFRYSYEKTRTVYEWENDEGIAAPVSYDTNIDYRASFADELMIINAAKEYPEYQELFSDFVNQINEYMDLSKDSIEKDEDYDKETLIDTIVIPFEDIVDIENLDIAY